MRKKKIIHRVGSSMLILSLLGSSVVVPGGFSDAYAVVEAAVENALQVSDKMEVSVDGKNLGTMQLYKNGVFESKVSLTAGTHTIQASKNGSTYGDVATVTVAGDKEVYVRVQNGTMIDSVNNADQFHTAAMAGNFAGLFFADESGDSYAISTWEPGDANAELTYIGGGIFKRTFTFKELEEDVTIADGGYKIACDDAWDLCYGDGTGNIAVTIPAGSTQFTVLADTINGVVYDSVRSGNVTVTQNSGNMEYGALDLIVSLIGTARQNEAVNWTADAKGYEFTQISDTLYVYQASFDKGTYEYKTVMNYTHWYEKTAGNKGFTLTEDNKNVIFLYDASDESLYDSVNDNGTVAEKLGMKEEEAVSKVQNNANGTTTFITTAAKQGDKVQLIYAPYSDPTDTTAVDLQEGRDGKGNFNQTFVSDAIFFGDEALDYVYYYKINGTRTLDTSAEMVTVSSENYSRYTREKFTGRFVTVPGTLPGPSWDASSNVMTYLGNGMYSYTFKDVPAANYEFKIATGTWAENYGVEGKADGSNYGIAVTEKQDITVYYIDMDTHRAVTSLTYDFAEIGLKGTSVDTKLEDKGLTGIYKATVLLPAGTYTDLVMEYKGAELPVDSFTLTEEKEVTFYFDPSTEIYYNDSSKMEVDASTVKYDSKDIAYKSVFGAVEEGEQVTFSIDTGKDATKALLVVKGKESKTLNMNKKADGDGYRWSTDLTLSQYGQYTYFFVIYYGSYIQIYCDDDGYYGTGTLTDISGLKGYDLIVYKAGYKTPDWVKNGVFYQIFPDRFFNGNESNDTVHLEARGATDYEIIGDWYKYPENPDQEVLNPGSYPENACTGDSIWNNEIYGGDLEGIIEKMDYLKALGVNVIYLNPIFSSISSHRYDTSDYKKIDPILGTLGDFTKLVKAAEENDMHIVLDGVFNHVSDDSIYFDRYYKFIGENGKVGAYPYWAYVYDYMEDNPSATKAQAETKAKTYFKTRGVTDFSYTEWFQVYTTSLTDAEGVAVTDTIGERTGKPVYGYDGWWGYDNMPVIYSTDGSEYQTGNWASEVIEGSSSVTQYWLQKGSNGWRLDVANEVSDETWKHFRDSVKGLDSDAVIIGEIWDDATEYILGDMYDSVMNYVFRDAVLSYAKGGNASDSVKELERMRERYPKEAFYAMMNLVGSHDTTRLLSFLDGIQDDRKQTDIESAFPTYDTTSEAAKQRQYVVAMIQMTYPGAPTIYYGDELGMVGADDPDNRRGMTWGKGNQDLVEWYATLANFRSQYSALRTGEIQVVDMGNEALMGYVRSDTDNQLFVVTNNSGSKVTVSCKVPAGMNMTGTTLTDLLNGDSYEVDADTIKITVPAYRGVILTEQVKEVILDTEALKSAYDSQYVVEEREPIVSPSPSPQVSSTPETSAVPAKAIQKITTARKTYKAALGSKPFSLGAKISGNGKVTYASSNKAVVTVSSKGKVTVRGTGKATITITASETSEYAKAVKKVNVIVVPKRIGCKITKKAVTTGSKKNPKKTYSINVSWKKNKGATGYEITFATDKNFTKGKTIKTVSSKTTTVTLANVKSATTYYVRLRSYKTINGVKYYSGYSDTRKIK